MSHEDKDNNNTTITKMMVMVTMMMTTVVIMFFNNNRQLHVSILEQGEVEGVDQENNKHRPIQSNKMRDSDAYLKELILEHRLIISLTNMSFLFKYNQFLI